MLLMSCRLYAAGDPGNPENDVGYALTGGALRKEGLIHTIIRLHAAPSKIADPTTALPALQSE